MKKVFELPEIQFSSFGIEDVIATSGITGGAANGNTGSMGSED